MPIRQTTSLSNVQQFTVANGNWDANRGPISEIVLHTMDGTVKAADERFNTVGSQVSSHYGIGVDGTIYQWVDEDNVAYANGNYLVNQIAISIEHEDLGEPNGVRPDILYQKSAELVADICKFYDFPADEEHILLHKNVIDKTYYPGGTACPDALDTNRIISLAAEILHPSTTSQTTPPITPETPPVIQVTTSPVDSSIGTTSSTPVSTTISQTPPQSDPAMVTNTPNQTTTPSSEASSPVIGQAGKVPITVTQPVGPSNQGVSLSADWLIQLILKGLSLIGIEK